MFYLSGVRGIAGYLRRRLETNGFSCYQRYSRSVISDIKATYKQSGSQYRDDQASESVYLYFRHLATEKEFRSIRISNHARGDDPTMVANYEVFGCIKRNGAVSYLKLLKGLATTYKFALSNVEVVLLLDTNYRNYVVQLNKLTKKYLINLKSARVFYLPERITVS